MPNSVLEAILAAGLSKPQLLTLLAVIRLTFGYGKESDAIGLTQLGRMIGMHRSHVGAAVRDLVAQAVIFRTPGEYQQVLAVNQNTEAWAYHRESESVTNAVTPTVTNGVTLESKRYDEIRHQSVTGIATKTVTNAVTLQRKKEKRKRASSRAVLERFDIFWSAYPRKEAKKTALAAFAKLCPDEQLCQRMLESLEAAKRSARWCKDGGEFIPYPATWLNGARWEDETAPATQKPKPRLVL